MHARFQSGSFPAMAALSARPWPGRWRYGAAILVSLAGIGLMMLLHPLFDEHTHPLVTLVLPMALAAWLGGLGPGLLATAVCCLACWAVFIAPMHEAMPPIGDWLRLLFAAGSGIVISLLAGRMHATLQALRQMTLRLSDELNERLRVEAALDEQTRELKLSSQRFRAIFDQAALGIVETDGNDRILVANRRYQELMGRSLEELRGLSILDLTAPEDLDRTAAMHKDVHAGAIPVGDYEKRYRRPDGSILWAHVIISPAHDQDGRFLRAVATVEDITEKKRSDEERERILRQLDEERARWKAIIDAIAEEVWICDPRGRVSLINKPVVMHLELGEVTEWPVDRVMEEVEITDLEGHPRAQDQLPLLRSLKGETLRAVEVMHEHRTGRTRYRHVSSAPMRDASGAIVGSVAVVRDVTDHYEALKDVQQSRSELARSNNDLEQFAYIVSHDLQEPLRMITGFGQLLQTSQQSCLDGQSRQYLDFMIEGAGRMSALVRGLLDYSRIKSGNGDKEPVELDPLLKDVLDNLKIAIESSGAFIDLSPLPEVYGNRTQLSQLFQNLIGNALKYRKPDQAPLVSICADRQGSDWFFSVTDNGIGIDARFHERIFVLFQRLHTREEYPGVGIGLALCKKIVERHGGRIWVDSTPGSGTTFYFTLPVLKPAPPTEPAVPKKETAPEREPALV